MLDYKYKNEIESISAQCQCPENIDSEFSNKKAFRFVFEDLDHCNNFIPPGKINPQRLLSENDKLKCGLFGLSLYSDENYAVEAYKKLKNTMGKRIIKVIGTHLSTGIIDSNDGNITKINKSRHFDLFEFSDTDIKNKFTILKEL